MFTATKIQAATYLFGVCLFSIAFLVFLNASLSFVITDIIHQKNGIGDAVGTLGFADELVALVACPVWGLLSDRVGVRAIATIGYILVGLSLIVFVQAKHVYPDLLLARMFFSLGGAATVTMVTAILPAMTGPKTQTSEPPSDPPLDRPGSSVSSELTITPARLRNAQSPPPPTAVSPNRLAGFVGAFTGCGALIALGVFLPLPTWFKGREISPAQALQDAFYVVGSIAFVVAVGCYFGLRNLNGEVAKGWRQIWIPTRTRTRHGARLSYRGLIAGSLRAARDDPRIGLGYLGGFVARASSVGVSLFIPLFVNAYFVDTGLCDVQGGDPSLIKEHCREAYLLAAKLTGISQFAALVCAPLIGFLADRSPRYQAPLLLGALAGVLGYSGFAHLSSPLTSGPSGSPGVYAVVILIGFSQISAIVCSLGLLSRAIEGLEEDFLRTGAPAATSEEQDSERTDPPQPDSASGLYEAATSDERYTASGDGDGNGDDDENVDTDESAALLGGNGNRNRSGTNNGRRASRKPPPRLHPTPLRELQGAIAGTYSLLGGAGILLLTKLGGWLFDGTSTAAPFVILAAFNLVLFAGGLVFALLPMVARRRPAA